MTAYIIYHDEMGIYLGSAMGMGFWSKMDPVGQTHAVTFDSPEQAKEVIATWDEPVVNCRFILVDIAEPIYASMDECLAAGLPGWET